MDEPTDDHLMRAFAAGDGHAFERLYTRHQAALYRFVRRLLGSHAAAQADEVFQDTWLRAIQARHGWAPQGASFRTWLFTLAHHRAVDCLRKTGREVSSSRDDDGIGTGVGTGAGGNRGNGSNGGHGGHGAEPLQPEGQPWAAWPSAADAPQAHDRAFWRAAGQRLLDCLDGLPLAQKAAFLLQHEDGLSVAEVAQALEVGFETAKTRLRYAMSRLRLCMGAYLPTPGSAS